MSNVERIAAAFNAISSDGDEIAALRAELAKTTRHLDDTISDLEAAHHEIDSLKAALERAEAERDKEKARRNIAQDDRNKLEAALATAQERVRELESDLTTELSIRNKALERLEEREAELAEANARAKLLEAERYGNHAEIDRLRARAKEAEKQADRWHAEWQGSFRREAETVARAQELEDEIKAARFAADEFGDAQTLVDVVEAMGEVIWVKGPQRERAARAEALEEAAKIAARIQREFQERPGADRFAATVGEGTALRIENEIRALLAPTPPEGKEE